MLALLLRYLRYLTFTPSQGGGGGGVGSVLATVQYGPAGLATYTLNTGAMTALDSTNLTSGTFTVPASGRVLVELYAYCSCTAAVVNNAIGFGVLNHSGGAQLGNTFNVFLRAPTTSTDQVLCVAPVLITGLTPGASLAVDFAACATNSANVFAQGYTGLVNNGQSAPATMIVKSA